MDLVSCISFFCKAHRTDGRKAVFGWLADRSSSRRAPLLLGFVSNAAATALLYAATNVWLLALSRFLQGLSAAIIYTVGSALLVDTVGTKDIGQWMGYVILSVSVGMMVAPALGGILYEKAGYTSIFVLMFSLITLDILLRLVMVEKKVARKLQKSLASEHHGKATDYGTRQSRADEPLSQQDRSPGHIPEPYNARDQPYKSRDSSANNTVRSIDHPREISSNTKHAPTLVTLLRSPRILTDLYGIWVNITLLVSFDSALPLFVERTFGWGSAGGGLIFLTLTLPILASPLAGKFADKFPSRWLSAVGFVLAALFITLLLLVTHGGTRQEALLCFILTLYGQFSLASPCPPGSSAFKILPLHKDSPESLAPCRSEPI